jgi:hypothetical protein
VGDPRCVVKKWAACIAPLAAYAQCGLATRQASRCSRPWHGIAEVNVIKRTSLFGDVFQDDVSQA